MAVQILIKLGKDRIRNIHSYIYSCAPFKERFSRLFIRSMEDSSNNNNEVRVVTAQIAVEHIPPPGPHLATPFNSLEEWLTFHCQHETRSEPLSEYIITFTEPPDVLVSLVGYQHGIEQGIPISKIVFQPKQYSWFELPSEQYGGLAREELIEKIHFELKEFFKTEQFKKSFLAHGYNISTNFEENIWSL